MNSLYWEIDKEVREVAKNCDITDVCEINKMICTRLKEKMVEEGRKIVDSLNIMDSDVKNAVMEGLLNGIFSTHRTLQGDFWDGMLKLIKKYGETKYFDARNEWAVKMCQRMAMAGEDPRTDEVLKKHIEDTRL
jgi:hypothetical protein